MSSFLIQSANQLLWKRRPVCLLASRVTTRRRYSHLVYHTGLYPQIHISLIPKCLHRRYCYTDWKRGSEDNHAYQVLLKLPRHQDVTKARNKIGEKPVAAEILQRISILSRNWSTESTRGIMGKFLELSSIAQTYTINLNDDKFTQMHLQLIDSLPYMDKKQLVDILTNITYWKAHTDAHQLFNRLDQAFISKFDSDEVNEILLTLNLWYLSSFAKKSKYCYLCLGRLSKNLNKLDPSQLVQFMFHVNISRHQKMLRQSNQLENLLTRAVVDLTSEEVCIICMSYFKTKTRTRNNTTLTKDMLKIIQKDIANISQISLTAFLKFLRLDGKLSLSGKMQDFYNAIYPELSRLSTACQVHLCLTGTMLMVYDANVLEYVTADINKNMRKVNIKYLERFLYSLSSFNYTPEESLTLFNRITNEFVDVEYRRTSELNQHSYVIVSSMIYLIRLGYFPGGLLPRVLRISTHDKLELWKKIGYDKGLEVLELDVALEIEWPDVHEHSKIPPDLRRSLVQKYHSLNPIVKFPTEEKLLSQRNFILHDVWRDLGHILGSECYVETAVILPYMVNPDLVLCVNADGDPEAIPAQYFKLENDKVKLPYDPHRLKWYVVVIRPRTSKFATNCDFLNAYTNMRIRQLQKLGYFVLMVPTMEYIISNPAEKRHMMEKMLQNSSTLNIKI